MTNDFYSYRELKDEKITSALRKAADDYEEGYIAEVKDMLADICQAIEFWEQDWELVYG